MKYLSVMWEPEEGKTQISSKGWALIGAGGGRSHMMLEMPLSPDVSTWVDKLRRESKKFTEWIVVQRDIS